jgi:hypothetical protein
VRGVESAAFLWDWREPSMGLGSQLLLAKHTTMIDCSVTVMYV